MDEDELACFAFEVFGEGFNDFYAGGATVEGRHIDGSMFGFMRVDGLEDIVVEISKINAENDTLKILCF